MSEPSYFDQPGGMPGGDAPLTGKAVFTDAYAVIPRGVLRDIVTSQMPGFNDARFWVLARPLSGFAETFSWYLAEFEPGGGSDMPEPDPEVEAVLFVASGTLSVTMNGDDRQLRAGDYLFIAPGSPWSLRADSRTVFHWIRKRYEPADNVAIPQSFIAQEAEIAPQVMSDSEGRWSTTRFVDADDLSHDMHVNIVNFLPGGRIPFEETHVMEHGIFILQGTARYLLNADWVEVEAGDFLWLRAFCPQACVATGDEPFRYLLYKDVNRHAILP